MLPYFSNGGGDFLNKVMYFGRWLYVRYTICNGGVHIEARQK